MRIPLDRNIKGLQDLPHTISFVIRKRQQIDSFYELPKEKRPPDDIIWEGTSEELEDWLDDVLGRKPKHSPVTELIISEIEG